MLRQGVTEAISGDAVTTSCLDYWEQVVLHHGESTRHRPASVQLVDLATDFEEIQRLLTYKTSSSSLLRLTRIAAQMAGLIFLTLIKIGNPAHARKWIRTARIAADEVGDPTICSWVRGQEAYVHYYRGDFDAASTAAREALAIAGSTPCAGVPLAAALQARAEARLGNPREAQRSLDRAESSLENLPAETKTASAFGYNKAQLHFHAGNAYTHMKIISAALPAQEEALRLYPASDFLDRTLVQFDQAICLALQGHNDAASTITLNELNSLNKSQRSGLITQRAWDVYNTLPITYRKHSQATDLHDALALTFSS